MAAAAASPRLGLLSGIRLAGNGAFRFLYPFLAVVAAELGVPDAWAGILVGALAVGGVASPIVRGWMVGAHERPRALLVRAGLVVGVGALAIAASPVAWVAVVALAVMGAGKPLLDTAAISYVAARTTFARRARATSTMELTWAGALIVVAPVAGLVATATSWRLALALIAVAVLVLTAVARRSLAPDDLGGSPLPSPTGTDPVRSGLRATFAALGATGRDYLLVVAFAFAALEATFSVFGLWLDRVHQVPLAQLGGFAAIVAIGELLGAGAVTLAADRIGKARTVRIGLAVCGGGLALLALTTRLDLGVAALAVGLVGSETAIVAAIAIASEVEPGARSRYLALLFSVTSLTRAVAGGIGPAVFSAVGIGGNAAMSVTSAVVAALLLRRAVARSPRLAT